MERLDLIQFGSLMGSLNRHIANERVSRVWDTFVGAQVSSIKEVKAHVKAIQNAVEIPGTQAAEGLRDFLQQVQRAKRK